MAGVLWLAAPLLVLTGTWLLLSAYDDPRRDLRRSIRWAAACLVVAVAVTVAGVLLDDRGPAPAPAVSTATD